MPRPFGLTLTLCIFSCFTDGDCTCLKTSSCRTWLINAVHTPKRIIDKGIIQPLFQASGIETEGVHSRYYL
jgi:hypothetical protein